MMGELGVMERGYIGGERVQGGIMMGDKEDRGEGE